MILTQNYLSDEMMQMTCFIKWYDFNQLRRNEESMGNKKTSRGGGFTKGSPMSFASRKRGLFVGMHNCLDGFPQALPEIKNGKVADYKKV
jgi:hypothetical protein